MLSVVKRVSLSYTLYLHPRPGSIILFINFMPWHLTLQGCPGIPRAFPVQILLGDYPRNPK